MRNGPQRAPRTVPAELQQPQAPATEKDVLAQKWGPTVHQLDDDRFEALLDLCEAYDERVLDLKDVETRIVRFLFDSRCRARKEKKAEDDAG